jgi:hypothetical protein
MEYGQQKSWLQTKASRTRFGFFVEGGTFTMGKVEDDVMHDWNNAPAAARAVFYMDETE